MGGAQIVLGPSFRKGRFCVGKGKHIVSSFFIGFLIVVGLGLLLYPTVANWWNDLHQSRAVRGYETAVKQLAQEDYDQMWEAARTYNESLVGRGLDRFLPTENELTIYRSLLDVTGTGILGYIEIPKLELHLPIYHGTGDAVLQFAVGHLEGSSVPSPDTGVHIALSGHAGLPSAKLFTQLPELRIGDKFSIHVLNQVLTYTVDQIKIVDPKDMSLLEISENENFCTLITCTPYGVNSHRLLVRGLLTSY